VILLLDANAVLWWLADDPTLSRQARSAIADPGNDIQVSAGSVWEIQLKRAIGKLTAPDGIVSAVESVGFVGLPITLGDAEDAGLLPPHHRDPFDRMLVAQAHRLDAVIATRDSVFAAYGVETLTA
jgi:PIN domain nuclease of toxin-antitoxin system